MSSLRVRPGARWPGASLLVALLVVSPQTSQASEPVRLRWSRGQGAESCPDQDELARRVTSRLGFDPFTAAASRSIEGYVEVQGRAWVAHLALRDPSGRWSAERTVPAEADDCVALADAVTLVIALSIDPDAALRPVPSASSSPPLAAPAPPVVSSTPPVVSSAPPVVSAPSASSAPPSGAVPVTMALRAVAQTGLVPAGPGASVRGTIDLGERLGASVGALWLSEQRNDQGEAGFGLTALTLGLCGRAGERASWQIRGCGGWMGGAVHAVVYQKIPTHPGERWWTAGWAGVALERRVVGPLVVEVGGELVVPLTRYRFVVSGQPEPAFQQASLGGMLFLGVGLSFF